MKVWKLVHLNLKAYLTPTYNSLEETGNYSLKNNFHLDKGGRGSKQH